MNKDKVYLKGYVIGRAADTLGYNGLMVQLENLDVVEIDKDLVHKEVDEPQLIKLKDIIARIEKFDLATKAVWINEILNKLGSDYGTLKYKDGYEQGKFDSAVERAETIIPQIVADWIKHCKTNGIALGYALYDPGRLSGKKVYDWIVESLENQELFARAWIYGYEVEKEKRYLVKIVGMDNINGYLSYNKELEKWFFGIASESKPYRARHTRKELEEDGFGWVFDCPGIDIEEVTE